MDRSGTGRAALWLGVLMLLAWPAQGQNQNITVDDQPTAEQRLQEVKNLRSAGRFDAAAELMQELIEQSRFKLVGLGDGRYADAERWCRQRLMRDGELAQAYRERYTATAARSLELAQQAPNPADALGEVYQRFTVTLPGLEAGLLRAGWLLEQGDAIAAGVLIDDLADHPDQNAVRARLIVLGGAAAIYNNNKERAEIAIEQLQKLELTEEIAALQALSKSIQPAALAGLPALADDADRPGEIRNALWDQPLAQSPSSARWVRDSVTMPVITPAMVLINNGRQVVALDRASGQRAWVYPADDDQTMFRGTVGVDRWQDRRAVALGANKLFAVLGECHGINDNRNPYVPANRLVCIDRDSGQARWERTAGVLKDNEPTLTMDRRVGRINLEYTHFVGTPIFSQGKVFVLLRRANSAQATHSTWLLAYDAQDSTLLWYRHLALASLNYTGDMDEVSPQVTLHGDTLFVTDSIATVAAIDAQTGGYRWLRVLPVGSLQTDRLHIDTEGVLAPPLPTRAGLLVCLALRSDRMVLLDPEDGALLQNFKDDPLLSSAAYVLPSGNDGVLVVSDMAVSLWDANQLKTKWTVKLNGLERPSALGAVTQRYAVIPTTKRALVLDLETGRELDRIESLTGNIVINEGEVFATRNRQVYAFNTWERAQQRLIKRVEQSPNDPSAGLALAALALHRGVTDGSVREGIAFALKALNNLPANRVNGSSKLVFDRLREMSPKAEDAELRQHLYESMALTSQSAEQEVAYHLDMAQFLIEQGEPYRAVDHLHAVIAEPIFSSQPYAMADANRSAGSYAQQLLEKVIRKHGRKVYARYDQLARAWLQEHHSAQATDITAITMIARRFPLSLAAVDLLLSAGQAKQEQGKDIEAVGLFQHAVVLAKDPDQRRLAVGRLMLFYLTKNRPSDALDLLELQTRDEPSFKPLDKDGSALSAEEWRERIKQVQNKQGQRGDLSDQIGTPSLIVGRLVRLANGTAVTGNCGRLYLQHEDGTVSRRDAIDPKQPVWSTQIPQDQIPQAKDVVGDRLVLLDDHEQQVLFWAQDAERVFALDPSTGKLLWSTRLTFEAAGPRLVSDVKGDPADANAQLLVTVSDAVVCFGQRHSARLTAIDRAVGTVLWKTRLNLSELTAIDADQWSVAGIGPVGDTNFRRQGGLSVLRLYTGEPVTASKQIVLDIVPRTLVVDRGRVLVTGDWRVTAIDIASEKTIWSRRVDMRYALKPVSAKAGPLMAVVNIRGVVHLLDTENSGQTVGNQFVQGDNTEAQVVLRTIDQQLWVSSGAGLFCFGQGADLKWRDALNQKDLLPRRMLVGQSRVALIADAADTPAGKGLVEGGAEDPGVRNYALFLFDREGGELLNQYTLGPLSADADPSQAVLFGRGLVMPMGGQTLVVPAVVIGR